MCGNVDIEACVEYYIHDLRKIPGESLPATHTHKKISLLILYLKYLIIIWTEINYF